MSKGKWGESFLKSGLPLEHLTFVTFKSLGWQCRSHIEYSRLNREKEETWFEFDLEAQSPENNNDTELSFLVECKYHDLSRFWFFLPHEIQRWPFNDSVLNCGPLQTLVDPDSRSLLELVPASIGGIVVSEDGAKQDNAVHTAIQQLINGFIPYCMQTFSFNLDFYNFIGDQAGFVPNVTAIIPMVVTNARVYRLKPDITDLELIRKATSPIDIADEVDWTWCHYDPSIALFDQNLASIEAHIHEEAEFIYRFPFVEERLREFADRPHWIAIVNIKALSKVVTTIYQHFNSLRTLTVDEILKKTKKRRRRRSPTTSA